MKRVPILIHGNSKKVIANIKALAEKISNKVYEMDDDTRAKVHIPAVFINNFVNHLVYKAGKLAEELGLEKQIYHALLQETVRKAIKNGAYLSQTGPAVRLDKGIIEKHRKKLQNRDHLLKIYNLITESIIQTYHEDHR